MHVMPMTDPALTRWPIASAVLLVSAFVLAEDNTRLDTPPFYGQPLADDIYERAEGWRQPPMAGDELRAPKMEPKSRIKLGYDSAYEELRARDQTRYSIKPTNQGELQPSTQIKFGF